MSHVVIRTVRPYPNEEAFLQEEGWTLSRKSIVLLDQPEHPEGTVVRFEVKLESGQRLMRAEGSVIRFRAGDGEFPSQLELKFRRFDAATKALIESAEALAALTEDDYEVIDDIEALSDVEASAPIHTEPIEASDPAPDSAPGVALSSAPGGLDNPAAGNTQPLATEPLGSFESDASPYTQAVSTEATRAATAEQELDAAVADATREARSSSLPAPPPPSSPDELGGSALKLDALISEALSEPPPADPGAPAVTPLPLSDRIPTLLDNSAPNAAIAPLAAGDVDELLAQPLDAMEPTGMSPPSEPPPLDEALERPAPSEGAAADSTASAEDLASDEAAAAEAAGAGHDSGVHPRPGAKVTTPARREELLAKLRERRLRKTHGAAQSGSGTSSGT